ncbi:MAG: bacterioferritin [Chloroflexi bacterium]|nr:bacterioferritin [Chloroflexota bacterium]
MKGNERILAALNGLLADELTAISQYMVHSEMLANWGFEKLHEAKEHQALDEMHHAEWLIARILFLEGTPIVSKLNPMKIGAGIKEMITNDQAAEVGAIKSYNDAITLGHEVKDQGSVDLLMKILTDEERHEDWAEAQLDQIGQMGFENYLTNQTKGAA